MDGIVGEPLPTVSTAQRVAAKGRMPLLPAVVVVGIFLPEAFGFMIGDFRLTPPRLVFLALIPVMLFSFATLIGSERYRFALSDLLMPATMAWMIFALSRVEGLSVGLKSGGVAALEFVGPYVVMRCLLRDKDQAHAIVRLFCIIAAVTGVLAVADTIADSPVIHDGLARLTGYAYFNPLSARISADDHRLGLLRAEGIYEHPILFGITMCYALLLTGDLDGRKRLWCRLGCGFGLFISLSSAPWEGFAIGIGLLIYRRLIVFPYRWLLLIMIGLFGFITIFMVAKNPLGWIFNHFTLDASTGYFRLMIWEYAGADVSGSPIVGIGTTADWFRPDWMPASVDSLWLRLAMLYGIPGSVITALALIGASTLSVRQTAANCGDIGAREVRLAETLGIITFLTIFLGSTVHYWGVTGMIVGMLAGMRAFLGQFAASGRAGAPDR
jgi:hypothetical protein